MQLISEYSDVLHAPTRDIELDEIPGLTQTISDMLETMKLNNGVGLAAPQVGLGINLFVMEWEGHSRVCINPVIAHASEELAIAEEGCLSFPNLRLQIKRPVSIHAAWYDQTGQPQSAVLNDTEARIFLHEWDHCRGICFTDRVGPVTLIMAKNKAEKLTRRTR